MSMICIFFVLKTHNKGFFGSCFRVGTDELHFNEFQREKWICETSESQKRVLSWNELNLYCKVLLYCYYYYY